MADIHVISEELWREQRRRDRFRTCFGDPDHGATRIGYDKLVEVLNSAAEKTNEHRLYIVENR